MSLTKVDQLEEEPTCDYGEQKKEGEASCDPVVRLHASLVVAALEAVQRVREQSQWQQSSCWILDTSLQPDQTEAAAV